MEQIPGLSPDMIEWLEHTSKFDAKAFYAMTDDELLDALMMTDDELLGAFISDENATLPTWRIETKDGITTMVESDPLKVAI